MQRRTMIVCGMWMATLLMAPVAHAQKLEIAAIVNDTIITTLDVVDRRDAMMALSGQEPNDRVLRQITATALQNLVNEALQGEEGKRLSLTVDDKEVDAAIADIEKSRGRPPGSLKKFFEDNHLSFDSMRNQIRTQILWNKVISKRLRRNVIISEDEIARGQQAAANAPGVPQVQIAAISLRIPTPKDEQAVSELAQKIRDRIAGGESFEAVAQSVVGKQDIHVNPSIWVPEDKLEPSLLAVLRELEPGQVTTPLRSRETFQIVYLQQRRTIKPAPPTTELALKQITLSLDEKTKDQEVDTLMSIAREVRKNPGDCVHKGVAGVEDFSGTKIDVEYVRTHLGDVAPDLLGTVATLNVGEVSEPFATKKGIQMLMLCERIEPVMALADHEQVKQKLFGEKMELEAEKLLRNLKRDAFIEIKFGDKDDHEPAE